MRASRRGMVDMIIMIVMIVFVLGMGTLAFLTYDKVQKEKQYLADLRKIPAHQQAEMDAVRARFSEVSDLIGFKGESAYTSPEAIQRLLEEGSYLTPDYYRVDTPSGDPNAQPLSTTKKETVTVRGYNKATQQWEERSIEYRAINDTERKGDQLYHYTDNQDLRKALALQDSAINDLFQKHIPNIEKQRKFQQEYMARVAGERVNLANEEYGKVQTAIETAESDIRTAHEDVAGHEQRLAEAMKLENETFQRLDSASIRDSRESAFAEARAAARARAQQREAMDAYRIQADERRRDDSRDPDGYIFLVDKRSGWVWINIGQRSDVRLNQTFQVLRPDASRTSQRSIGEIRVKEILQGNIARARVDALDDTDDYPEAGDLILNPNFSTRQYRDWALVGDFGGQWTTLTRQQLVDLLRGVGFNVQSSITRTTDAVIIGGNWMEDETWQNARDQRLTFETYSEDEVLYFLGLQGPDQND